MDSTENVVVTEYLKIVDRLIEQDKGMLEEGLIEDLPHYRQVVGSLKTAKNLKEELLHLLKAYFPEYKYVPTQNNNK